MSRKVLLIEDEPNITEAIRFLLTREGWQVETHAEGTDAVQVILSARPGSSDSGCDAAGKKRDGCAA